MMGTLHVLGTSISQSPCTFCKSGTNISFLRRLYLGSTVLKNGNSTNRFEIYRHVILTCHIDIHISSSNFKIMICINTFRQSKLHQNYLVFLSKFSCYFG